MQDRNAAKAIEEIFEAAGHVSATPMFEDKTLAVAPEVIAALECGMSTGLVVAHAVAAGEMEGRTPQQIAANMKVAALKAYVDTVVFGGDQPEGEAPTMATGCDEAPCDTGEE